jgi:hypothetical protein
MAENYWTNDPSSPTQELRNPYGAVLQTRPNPNYNKPAATSGQQNGSGAGITGVYNQAVGQQAKDYSNIMDQYGRIGAAAQSPGQTVTPTPISPQSYTYTPSPQLMQSISNLQGLSQTGGYAPGDLADIRARSIAPIRSIYSSAQQNIDRNRVLRGSSTGYAATKAKMARDLAQQISDTTTNANAAIAGDVAKNKIGIAPAYAQAAGAESSLSNQYGRANTDTANDFSKFNANQVMDAAKINQGASGQALDATRGMASLYGTTPALASLYGSQALQSTQLQNLMKQQAQSGQGDIVGQILRSL